MLGSFSYDKITRQICRIYNSCYRHNQAILVYTPEITLTKEMLSTTSWDVLFQMSYPLPNLHHQTRLIEQHILIMRANQPYPPTLLFCHGHRLHQVLSVIIWIIVFSNHIRSLTKYVLFRCRKPLEYFYVYNTFSNVRTILYCFHTTDIIT